MFRIGSTVILLIAFIYALAPDIFSAEVSISRYRQPYMGKWPDFYTEFSAEKWKEKASENLAHYVEESDVIIIGLEGDSKGSKFPVLLKGQKYESKVNVFDIIKGEVDAGLSFDLEWEPFATGGQEGAKLVFFLKKKTGEHSKEKIFSVLKVLYVYPDEDNLMHVVETHNCSADVGMDVIRHLVTGGPPHDLAPRLMEEYTSDDWGKMYSAVVLAGSDISAGLSILEKMVSATEAERFDIQLYGIAAYALASKQGNDGIGIVLKNIPSFESTGRVPESIAFDITAMFGDQKTIPIIKEVVKDKPELAVSAAFSLAKFGGAEGRGVIESWLADEKLSGQKTKISSDWTVYYASLEKTFGELFKEALIEKKEEKKEGKNLH